MSIIKRYSGWLNEMSIYDDELKKYNTVLSNIEDYKNNCNYINNKIIILKDEASGLNNIRFKKFEKENNKLYTSVLYNAKMKSIIEELSTILEESEGKNVYDKYFSLIYPDGEEKDFNIEIEIELKHLNRIHIPIGLPYILKGCRLGNKIYKTLIHKLGYLSTNILDRTIDSIFVWNSLRKETDIYTFVRNENIMCVSSELNFEKIEELIEQFFKNLNDKNIILDDDFKNKYITEIRNSNKISYLL